MGEKELQPSSCGGMRSKVLPALYRNAEEGENVCGPPPTLCM